MTQAEMHLALCEWIGWRHHCTGELNGYWISPEGRMFTDPLPPLTLDWLHEVAGKLDNKMTSYHECLYNVAGGMSNTIEATKEQRLEALCRTLFPERFA